MLSFLKHIFYTVLFFALVWFAGLVWFVCTFPTAPTKLNLQTDAIVVLTGGAGRLEKGFTLLLDGKAPRLFVSGVEVGVELPELLKQKEIAPIADKIPLDKVELGHNARSTFQNAEETSAWVKQNNIKSIRLVTGNYHMPRSTLEMQQAMPDITILPEPVFPAEFSGNWLTTESALFLVLSEYHKFLISYAAHRIGILKEG